MKEACDRCLFSGTRPTLCDRCGDLGGHEMSERPPPFVTRTVQAGMNVLIATERTVEVRLDILTGLYTPEFEDLAEPFDIDLASYDDSEFGRMYQDGLF
jgi:hypothetical protein